jgi:hypothetical protein
LINPIVIIFKTALNWASLNEPIIAAKIIAISPVIKTGAPENLKKGIKNPPPEGVVLC